MFMILYTVQVTGLQLRDPAPFNDLLLELIFYIFSPRSLRESFIYLENDLLVHEREDN